MTKARLIPLGRALALWLLPVALFTLAACSSANHWKLKNISGLVPDLEFTLTEDSGRTVHADDFRGKVALLYFGYTHCPDACPLTLVKLSQGIAALGADADKVQVLFVSVDPQRDTVAVLKRYVKNFGPHVVGLRPDDQELRQLAARYRVAYGYGKADADGNYEVSHSSAVFIFGPHGRARLLTSHADKTDVITTDLRRLIAEG